MTAEEKTAAKESANLLINNLSEAWNYLRLTPGTWRERLAVIRMNQEAALLFEEAEEVLA